MIERDEEGRPSKWVTETEPEFDAVERGGWEALDEYRDALCPNCGQLKSICSNPDQDLYPQRTVCHITATRLAINRRVQAHHEKAKPSPQNGWVHPLDGTTVWMSTSDLTPDDDFDGALPLAD